MLILANEGDSERIARLHIASWRATYKAELSEGFLLDQDVSHRAKEWRQRIAEGLKVLLALEGEELVGFVASGPSGGPTPGAREWEIYNLHVLAGFQGRGLGSELLDAAAALGRGAGFRVLELSVVETNASARRFYERKGMVWDGSRQHHPVSATDALAEVRYRTDL